MEKILLVIHARQPATASIDFACRVAALTSSKLTGLFVENLFDSATSATQEEKNYSETREQEDSTTVVENDTDRAVKLFVQACAIQGISAETTIDKGEPIQQVIYESRFADLLILDPGMDFYGAEEQLPTHFTREVLTSSECPVLLAPRRVDEMEEVGQS